LVTTGSNRRIAAAPRNLTESRARLTVLIDLLRASPQNHRLTLEIELTGSGRGSVMGTRLRKELME
jgi:hypothetical protein